MAKRNLKLTYYRAGKRHDGQWHWRIVSSNGKVMASSAEGDGFTSRTKAEHNFEALHDAMADGRYVTTEDNA